MSLSGDLSDLNPNFKVGRRSTSQTLQRMPDRRRYPILVVLLHETTLVTSLTRS